MSATSVADKSHNVHPQKYDIRLDEMWECNENLSSYMRLPNCINRVRINDSTESLLISEFQMPLVGSAIEEVGTTRLVSSLPENYRFPIIHSRRSSLESAEGSFWRHENIVVAYPLPIEATWQSSSNIATQVTGFPREVPKRDRLSQERTSDPLRVYKRRIDELRGFAAEDGYTLNKDSESDFRTFVISTPSMRKASLVLIENGNLRSNWRDQNGNQVGIEFLGNQNVEYVFHRIIDDLWFADIDTLKGVKTCIKSFKLGPLIGV